MNLDDLGDDAPRACATGKRTYLRRRDAARHAKRLRRTREHRDLHSRPYICPRCGLWHVGTVPAEVIAGERTADEHYARPPAAWRAERLTT